MGTFWVVLGRIGSIFGQKPALPELLENTIVIYAYSVYNAYFTVLNVPNDTSLFEPKMQGHPRFFAEGYSKASKPAKRCLKYLSDGCHFYSLCNTYIHVTLPPMHIPHTSSWFVWATRCATSWRASQAWHGSCRIWVPALATGMSIYVVC